MAGCRSYPLTHTQQFDILPLAHGERPDDREQVIGNRSLVHNGSNAVL
jgi:hypothetical protein